MPKQRSYSNPSDPRLCSLCRSGGLVRFGSWLPPWSIPVKDSDAAPGALASAAGHRTPTQVSQRRLLAPSSCSLCGRRLTADAAASQSTLWLPTCCLLRSLVTASDAAQTRTLLNSFGVNAVYLRHNSDKFRLIQRRRARRAHAK